MALLVMSDSRKEVWTTARAHALTINKYNNQYSKRMAGSPFVSVTKTQTDSPDIMLGLRVGFNCSGCITRWLLWRCEKELLLSELWYKRGLTLYWPEFVWFVTSSYPTKCPTNSPLKLNLPASRLFVFLFLSTHTCRDTHTHKRNREKGRKSKWVG